MMPKKSTPNNFGKQLDTLFKKFLKKFKKWVDDFENFDPPLKKSARRKSP